MVTAVPATQAVRFHLSLNVSDLARSVAFYRALFDRDPAKQRDDYAKFEVDDPPLVLSLEPAGRGVGGALNHLGFRLPDPASLVEMQRRLEQAGIRSQREEGVECCYARQTKFWVTDPDNTLWEFYVLEGDLDHRGAGQTREEMLPPAVVEEDVSWEHRLSMPVPRAVPLADNTAAEVRLRGSFNAALSESEQQRLLAEARRVLRPGGKLLIHVLVADRPLEKLQTLPGLAALVQAVPVDGELLRAVAEAGFVGLSLQKFGSAPCFRQEAVEMRELLLAAYQPVVDSPEGHQVVLYRGPFAQVVDDKGHVYPRGERVVVSARTAEQLGQGPYAEHFTCFRPDSVGGCS
jgi:catechol 2,3-dioxygenase-like lactoylglutathione lyase family enzyme